MAITINNGAGNPIGPGIIVVVSGMAGPTPLDDYVVAEISDGAHVNVLCSGSVETHGATTVVIVPGVHDGGPVLNPAITGLAPGAAVNIDVEQFHAGGTGVASTTQTATWDPVSGLWFLARSESSVDLSVVLAAVQKTFVNAP